MNNLTHKQDNYCRERASGKGYAAAYKAAGYSPNQSRNTAERHAYALEHESGATSDKILARIDYYQRQADRGAIMDLRQIQAQLSEIANGEKETTGAKLKALDQLARMQGGYTDRTEQVITGGLSIEDKTRAAADYIASVLAQGRAEQVQTDGGTE